MMQEMFYTALLMRMMHIKKAFAFYCLYSDWMLLFLNRLRLQLFFILIGTFFGMPICDDFTLRQLEFFSSCYTGFLYCGFCRRYNTLRGLKFNVHDLTEIVD